MAGRNPRVLLVEGKDEQFVIPFMMDEYIIWGDTKETRAVEIKSLDGDDNLLRPGVIEAEFKSPGLAALGIVIDADESFASRWSRIRDRCHKLAPSFPAEPRPGGVIAIVPGGPRLGIWMMPDNRSRGMLETFLGSLIVPKGRLLWDLARESCDRARSIEGAFTEAHRDKAQIHTYLAWIDPPGLSLSSAVLKRAIDARLPLAEDFANWFVELYRLDRRSV